MKDFLKLTAFLSVFCLGGIGLSMLTSSGGRVSFVEFLSYIGFGLCVGWIVFLPFGILMANEAKAPEKTNPAVS